MKISSQDSALAYLKKVKVVFKGLNMYFIPR
ncbi:hypothetical protein A2U01_0066531, partial [Trifolium medium]|nr:hypothetical protein [Trifolium medium]